MAPILEGKAGGCNRRVVLLSRAALVVPGDGLKRKRIVRTAEVTIETEEHVIIHRSSGGAHPSLQWCPFCRRQVEMVTPEQAGQIAGVSERTIYRWVEAGTIHFLEDSGHTYVCVPALPARKQPHE
jgi:hypothetical protein